MSKNVLYVLPMSLKSHVESVRIGVEAILFSEGTRKDSCLVQMNDEEVSFFDANSQIRTCPPNTLLTVSVKDIDCSRTIAQEIEAYLKDIADRNNYNCLTVRGNGLVNFCLHSCNF